MLKAKGTHAVRAPLGKAEGTKEPLPLTSATANYAKAWKNAVRRLKRKGKSKTRKGKPPMTEARILDVSNDISENIDNGQTVEQLREVCRYWMNFAVRVGALRSNQLAHVANCALQMMTEHKERAHGAHAARAPFRDGDGPSPIRGGSKSKNQVQEQEAKAGGGGT